MLFLLHSIEKEQYSSATGFVGVSSSKTSGVVSTAIQQMMGPVGNLCRFSFLLAFSAGSLVLAQGVTGSVTGVVTDEKGASVPKAKVVAKNTGTEAETIAIADSNGSYIINNLPPGMYSIQVEATGFQKASTAPE